MSDFGMVVVLVFTAEEIVKGDAGYKANEILEAIKRIPGVKDAKSEGEEELEPCD